jgi:hypothetical protein
VKFTIRQLLVVTVAVSLFTAWIQPQRARWLEAWVDVGKRDAVIARYGVSFHPLFWPDRISIVFYHPVDAV